MKSFQEKITFLASAKLFGLNSGGTKLSKKRISSPSEKPMPSLGVWGLDSLAALGNSVPGVGDSSTGGPKEEGSTGALCRNLKSEDKRYSYLVYETRELRKSFSSTEIFTGTMVVKLHSTPL